MAYTEKNKSQNKQLAKDSKRHSLFAKRADKKKGAAKRKEQQ